MAGTWDPKSDLWYVTPLWDWEAVYCNWGSCIRDAAGEHDDQAWRNAQERLVYQHDAASTMLEVRCPIFSGFIQNSKYVYVGIQYFEFWSIYTKSISARKSDTCFL